MSYLNAHQIKERFSLPSVRPVTKAMRSGALPASLVGSDRPRNWIAAEADAQSWFDSLYHQPEEKPARKPEYTPRKRYKTSAATLSAARKELRERLSKIESAQAG